MTLADELEVGSVGVIFTDRVTGETGVRRWHSSARAGVVRNNARVMVAIEQRRRTRIQPGTFVALARVKALKVRP